MPRKTRLLDLIPPGEVLLEEFMVPSGISQNRLARDLDVPVARINEIVHGKRAITVDTALRLAKYFGTTPEMWINLQSGHDLRRAKRDLWPEIDVRVLKLDVA